MYTEKGYSVKGFFFHIFHYFDVLLLNAGIGAVAWFDVVEGLLVVAGLLLGLVYGFLRIMWAHKEHKKRMEED